MVLDCGKGRLTMTSHYGFPTSFSRSTKASKRAVAFHCEIAAETATRRFYEIASKNAPNSNAKRLPRACRTCHTSFLSSNVLHEHLRTSGHAIPRRSDRLPHQTRRHRLDEPWRKGVDGGNLMDMDTCGVLTQGSSMETTANAAVVSPNTSIANMCDKGVAFHCFGKQLLRTCHRARPRMRLCGSG